MNFLGPSFLGKPFTSIHKASAPSIPDTLMTTSEDGSSQVALCLLDTMGMLYCKPRTPFPNTLKPENLPVHKYGFMGKTNLS